MKPKQTPQISLPLIKPFHEYECMMFYTLNYRDLSQCPLVGLDDALYASLLSRAKSVGKAAIVKYFDVVNIERRRFATQSDSTFVCWSEHRNTVALLLNSSQKLAFHGVCNFYFISDLVFRLSVK